MTELIQYTQSVELKNTFPEFNELTLHGTIEDPLFLSSQVKDMLKLNTRIYFDDLDINDDYVKVKLQTHSQTRDVIMLTEQGLYTVLARSRTDLGKRFCKFIKIVLKELRLRGSVTLSESLKLLQAEIEKKDNYIKILDEECERIHEKELLQNAHNEELKTRMFIAEKKNAAVRGFIAQPTNNVDDLLWEKAKEKCLMEFYFTRVDDSEEPADDDDAIWKLSRSRPDPDLPSFIIYVWPGTTIKKISDWLTQGHGIKQNGTMSSSKFVGSMTSITESINKLLLI